MWLYVFIILNITFHQVPGETLVNVIVKFVKEFQWKFESNIVSFKMSINSEKDNILPRIVWLFCLWKKTLLINWIRGEASGNEMFYAVDKTRMALHWFVKQYIFMNKGFKAHLMKLYLKTAILLGTTHCNFYYCVEAEVSDLCRGEFLRERGSATKKNEDTVPS